MLGAIRDTWWSVLSAEKGISSSTDMLLEIDSSVGFDRLLEEMRHVEELELVAP